MKIQFNVTAVFETDPETYKPTPESPEPTIQEILRINQDMIAKGGISPATLIDAIDNNPTAVIVGTFTEVGQAPDRGLVLP